VRRPQIAAAATGEDWIPRIAAWHGSADALVLRGAEDAWSFTPDG
jgi:hypothetical protein